MVIGMTSSNCHVVIVMMSTSSSPIRPPPLPSSLPPLLPPSSLLRSQEETASLKRRLEKLKNRELATTSDEILLEELKTYKVGLAWFQY